MMKNKKKKSSYKLRMPRDIQAEPGETVWGNGCEMRGCLVSSSGVFIMCEDGIAREFCAFHQCEGKH